MKKRYCTITLLFLASLAPAQMLQTIVQDAGGYRTYSDNFNRANGDLGTNWKKSIASGPAAVGALTIVSNQVMAATVPMLHSQAVYKGAFANNQWTSFIVASGNGGISAGQEAVVRANGTDFYNDAVAAGTNMGGLSLYRIGNSASIDFCGAVAIHDYAIGDRHKLAAAGTNPVWFWAFRNDVINAGCVDTVDLINGGLAGLGEDDNNTVPTLISDDWQGGSLPNFSPIPADNFNRPDAGWLGVNWGYNPNGLCTGNTGSYPVLSGHAAVNLVSSGLAVSVWTTPFGATANQASTVTIGSLHGGDFVGPVVRYTPNSTICQESYYFAFIQQSGATFLYKYTPNSQTQLASLGTFSGTPTSIELDATGTNPVTLTVKVNGTVQGSPFVDSTYHLAGGYEGFNLFGSNLTTVVGWTGN
jgi:hypothetical protein